MAQELRQGTAATVKLGPFIDDTDGKTPETAVALTDSNTLLAKAGGAFAAKHETTHPAVDAASPGGCYYDVLLDTTDTNTLGTLDAGAYVAGALLVPKSFMVVTQAYWDNKYSTGTKDVNVVAIAGAAVDASGAQLGVNVVNWKGAAAPALTGDPYAEAALAHAAVDALATTDDLAAAILVTAANKLATDASGCVTPVASFTNMLTAAAADALAAHTAVDDATSGLPAIKTGLGSVTLAATQGSYAPAKAGDQMDFVNAPNATAQAALASTFWNTLLTVVATADSIGKRIKDFITDLVYTAPPSVTTIGTNTAKVAALVETDGGHDRFKATALEAGPVGGGLDASGVRTAIGMASANLDTQLAAIPAGVRTNLATELSRIDAAITTRNAVAPATPANVTDARDHIETHGDDHWGVVEVAGGVPCTLTLHDTEGHDVADATVWVTSDLAGDTVVQSGTTTAAGTVTFTLVAGTTYYRWATKAGINFTNNPAVFVAVAD